MVKVQALRRAVTAAALLAAFSAGAATPAELAQAYEAQARATSPTFGGFSAVRGKAFFEATHGGEWSCSSCHTRDPLGAGRHAKTSKPIRPLAPAADAERFTSFSQAEKWFKRNCNDVLNRTCTAQEKGDVLAYLMELRR